MSCYKVTKGIIYRCQIPRGSRWTQASGGVHMGVCTWARGYIICIYIYIYIYIYAYSRTSLCCSCICLMLSSTLPAETCDSPPKTRHLLDSLRGSSVKIGTMQRRLAWPLRRDDTRNSRGVNDCRMLRARTRHHTCIIHICICYIIIYVCVCNVMQCNVM